MSPAVCWLEKWFKLRSCRHMQTKKSIQLCYNFACIQIDYIFQFEQWTKAEQKWVFDSHPDLLRVLIGRRKIMFVLCAGNAGSHGVACMRRKFSVDENKKNMNKQYFLVFRLQFQFHIALNEMLFTLSTLNILLCTHSTREHSKPITVISFSFSPFFDVVPFSWNEKNCFRQTRLECSASDQRMTTTNWQKCGQKQIGDKRTKNEAKKRESRKRNEKVTSFSMWASAKNTATCDRKSSFWRKTVRPRRLFKLDDMSCEKQIVGVPKAKYTHTNTLILEQRVNKV